jgi:hypothetical protein
MAGAAALHSIQPLGDSANDVGPDPNATANGFAQSFHFRNLIPG